VRLVRDTTGLSHEHLMIAAGLNDHAIAAFVADKKMDIARLQDRTDALESRIPELEPRSQSSASAAIGRVHKLLSLPTGTIDEIWTVQEKIAAVLSSLRQTLAFGLVQFARSRQPVA
jgi:translation elongation factor EF-1alpha